MNPNFQPPSFSAPNPNEFHAPETLPLAKEKEKSGFATAALVLSILAAAFCFFPVLGYFSLLLGVLSTVFAIVALVKKAPVTKPVVSVCLSAIAVAVAIFLHLAVYNSLLKEFSASFGNLFLSEEEMTAAVLEKTEITFGTFTVFDEETMDAALPLTVKNTGEAPAYLYFEVDALTSDNTRLAQDYFFIECLAPGQTEHLELFYALSPNLYEDLKNAEFSVSFASDESAYLSLYGSERLNGEDLSALEVTFDETLTVDEKTGKTELFVTAKNKREETTSFTLYVEMLDENGDRIAFDTLYTESLAPGQSARMSAFTLIPHASRDKLDGATFRLVFADTYFE